MNEAQVRALFLLAGFDVSGVYETKNRYWGSDDVKGPWFLMKTQFGLVRIGWRKRVIEIEWPDLKVRKIITEDDFTKNETLVHAYSYHKALEYLTELRREASRFEEANQTR